MHLIIALLALALVARGAPTVLAEQEDVTKFIQPGRGYTAISATNVARDSPCTIGFIMIDDAGRFWAVSAGHCDTDNAPHREVRHSVFGIWGKFVYSEYVKDGDYFHQDLGLIRIYDEFQDNVDVAIAGWGGPTGIAPAGSVTPGETLGHTGAPFAGNDATSSGEIRRSGTAVWHNSTMWSCECVAERGDSGGPVIEVDTGRLLGVKSGFLFDGYPEPHLHSDKIGGVVLDLDLDRMRAADPAFASLRLATAWYAPPR